MNNFLTHVKRDFNVLVRNKLQGLRSRKGNERGGPNTPTAIAIMLSTSYCRNCVKHRSIHRDVNIIEIEINYELKKVLID